MRVHAAWRLCGLSLLTMLLAAPALAQDQVRTHGSASDDRGRIVFDWPSPVGYRAAIEGRNLVVRFDRPFRSDIAETAQRLDGYVANVILSGDGRVDRTSVVWGKSVSVRLAFGGGRLMK